MRAGDAEEEKTPTLITLYRFRLSAGVAVCLTGASEVNNEGVVFDDLGEGAALWVAPELTDPVGSLQVGEHQDVEQFGAGSRTECVEALT